MRFVLFFLVLSIPAEKLNSQVDTISEKIHEAYEISNSKELHAAISAQVIDEMETPSFPENSNPPLSKFWISFVIQSNGSTSNVEILKNANSDFESTIISYFQEATFPIAYKDKTVVRAKMVMPIRITWK